MQQPLSHCCSRRRCIHISDITKMSGCRNSPQSLHHLILPLTGRVKHDEVSLCQLPTTLQWSILCKGYKSYRRRMFSVSMEATCGGLRLQPRCFVNFPPFYCPVDRRFVKCCTGPADWSLCAKPGSPVL